MGLLNKLKNVLFEEEEIDVPEEPVISKSEEKTIPQKEEIRPKIRFEEESSSPPISDKDLFKAEKTFDFPVFDEEEFDLMKDPVPEEPKKTMGINLFDYERPTKQEKKPSTPEIKGRIYDSKSREKGPTKFKPSPVISPVYGVLDKKYKKEDIVVVKEESQKKIDVDDVRKKAFGTLEEDIEKSIVDTPKRKMEAKKEKDIDDLLEESSFSSIPVKEEKHVEKEVTLEVLDKAEEKKQSERIEAGETLENDLFDLIDSMYEEKEEE